MRSQSRRVVVVLLGLFCISMCADFAVAQTTWWVDASAAPGGTGTSSSPFQTIQQGIAAASAPLDKVRVRPGSYLENIDYLGKSIEVRSTAGAASTTIDGSSNYASTVVMSGATPSLDGFTVKNGSGTSRGFHFVGSGIYVDATTSVLIRNCVIRDNLLSTGAPIDGGGIGSDTGTGIVEFCTIEHNGYDVTTGCFAGDGGGVYGPLLVRYCTIRNNSTVLNGGGCYGCTLLECTVEGNYAAQGGGLAFCTADFCTIVNNLGFSCDLSLAYGGGANTCTLRDCLVAGNRTFDWGGGAVYSILERCEVRGNIANLPDDPTGSKGGGCFSSTVTDCTVHGNDAGGLVFGYPPGNGGGLFACSAVRTTIYENTADITGGVDGGSLNHCVVWNNQAGGVNSANVVTNSVVRANGGAQIVGVPTVSYSNVQGGSAGTGNINADPRFWRPYGSAPSVGHDFHLMAGSPCINSGDPASPLDPDGSRTDMGVFPFDASWCPATVIYCTAGTSALGCVPSIVSAGTPHLSAANGFFVTVSNMEGQKQAMFFYGVSGSLASPWSPGSSLLCVKAPTQRTGVQTSTGTNGVCNGQLQIDMNVWRVAHPTALGTPFVAGGHMWMQAWYRDPLAVKTTGLSNALQFTWCP